MESIRIDFKINTKEWDSINQLGMESFKDGFEIWAFLWKFNFFLSGATIMWSKIKQIRVLPHGLFYQTIKRNLFYLFIL